MAQMKKGLSKMMGLNFNGSLSYSMTNIPSANKIDSRK
jgi:hypothetical protein